MAIVESSRLASQHLTETFRWMVKHQMTKEPDGPQKWVDIIRVLIERSSAAAPLLHFMPTSVTKVSDLFTFIIGWVMFEADAIYKQQCGDQLPPIIFTGPGPLMDHVNSSIVQCVDSITAQLKQETS